eukprot:3104373-Prymnesium_polylepis.2
MPPAQTPNGPSPTRRRRRRSPPAPRCCERRHPFRASERPPWPLPPLVVAAAHAHSGRRGSSRTGWIGARSARRTACKCARRAGEALDACPAPEGCGGSGAQTYTH